MVEKLPIAQSGTGIYANPGEWLCIRVTGVDDYERPAKFIAVLEREYHRVSSYRRKEVGVITYNYHIIYEWEITAKAEEIASAICSIGEPPYPTRPRDLDIEILDRCPGEV